MSQVFPRRSAERLPVLPQRPLRMPSPVLPPRPQLSPLAAIPRTFDYRAWLAGRNVPDYALTIFGKPARETNCDCDRATMPTLLQALYLRNDPEMHARIESQRAETPAWITELRAANSSSAISASRIDQFIAEVFLRTVSRPPTGEEMQQARADIARASDPISGVRDLLWVMLNTREFTVNH